MAQQVKVNFTAWQAHRNLVYPVLPALHILILKIESWLHLQLKLSWPYEPEAILPEALSGPTQS